LTSERGGLPPLFRPPARLRKRGINRTQMEMSIWKREEKREQAPALQNLT